MRYLDLDIKEINQLLKDKKIKPIDLVNETFKRIEESNLNCFITLNKEEAIKKAKELENMEVDNLLFGLPIAIYCPVSAISYLANWHVSTLVDKGIIPLRDNSLISVTL